LGWVRFTHHLRRYGLTLDQYHAHAEAQDFSCAVCLRDDVLLTIDHDHSTRIVRGLLCRTCNDGLGKFKDDPARIEAALHYLRR
jgi:hypothetical protein